MVDPQMSLQKACLLGALLLLSTQAIARDPSVEGQPPSEKSKADRAQQLGAEDIYNPEAYDGVSGFDASGTYVLIKRGTISYISHTGEKSESHEKFKRDIRQVVKLQMDNDGEIHIYNVCMNRDWGNLTRKGLKLAQHTDNRARFSGSYSARFAALGKESSPKEQVLDPLSYGPGEEGSTSPITNVQVDARFDLIRIADFKSPVGRASFSYSSGGSKGSIEKGCLFQIHESIRVHMVNRPPSNIANLENDSVYLTSPDFTTSLVIGSGSSDIKASGVGPIGGMARFSITFRSAVGETYYQDTRVKKKGDTGIVQHSIVKNDVRGLDLSGSAIPPGGSDLRFSKKSRPLTYRVDWPLK